MPEDSYSFGIGVGYPENTIRIMPAYKKPPGMHRHLILHVVHMVIGLMVVCMFHFLLMMGLEAYRGDQSSRLTKQAEIIGAIRPGLLVGKRADGILVAISVTNAP